LSASSFEEDCPGGGPPPLGDRPVVLVAAVALVDPDGRVLIAQRPAGKSMAEELRTKTGLGAIMNSRRTPGIEPATCST